MLSSYHVFISPSSLGSDDKLPCKAEELGAEVHTWRNAGELQNSLSSHGIVPSATDAVVGNGGRTDAQNIVVLVEKEEVGASDCPLSTLIASLSPSHRKLFVLPTWLAETFSQRRSLPLETFTALPAPDADGPATKRQRTYEWQSEAEKKLKNVSEESRAQAL